MSAVMRCVSNSAAIACMSEIPAFRSVGVVCMWEVGGRMSACDGCASEYAVVLQRAAPAGMSKSAVCMSEFAVGTSEFAVCTLK